MTPELSIVVPLRDELPNVVALYDEWTGVLVQLGVPYELILVDDGSTDGTFDALCTIERSDPSVRVVRLARPYGQTAALSAGFDRAEGRYIVTVDGDLQNDPVDLPPMLGLARRFDLVCGWRRHRRDAWLTRRLPAAVANWLLGAISGVRVHDSGCGLKVFRGETARALTLAPGMHRYLPALVGALGGRVAEAIVTQRPRRAGVSKNPVSRRLALARDLPRLRARMREACAPRGSRPPIYEIAEVREPQAQPEHLLD